LFVASANYLATLSVAAAGVAAESVAAESLAAESLAVESTEVESVVAGASALLPQEAKEIAARATNMKTNFFIVFVSLE
jgi:hypothetical protein